MAANYHQDGGKSRAFMRNKDFFHTQQRKFSPAGVNFSSVKELRKATGSCRNGYQ